MNARRYHLRSGVQQNPVEANNSSPVPGGAVWQALQGRLAVSEWAAFTRNIKRIYDTVLCTVHDGRNAEHNSVLSDQVLSGLEICCCRRGFSCLVKGAA